MKINYHVRTGASVKELKPFLSVSALLVWKHQSKICNLRIYEVLSSHEVEPAD
jgi:hypothetical protein